MSTDLQHNISGMRIGLIAMAAKPLHAGHFGLIVRAATENDEVNLYVSTGDRIKRGEYPITGSQMLKVWGILLQIMPGNVNIYYVDNPTRAVYEQLGTEEERLADGDWDVAEYRVYSDPVDLTTNYTTSSMEKYFPLMWQDGLITLQPITRTSTVNVSGTQMRKWLARGDAQSLQLFIEHLPEPLSAEQRKQIWDILTQSNSTI